MRMNAKKKEKTRRETTAIKVWVTPAHRPAESVITSSITGCCERVPMFDDLLTRIAPQRNGRRRERDASVEAW